MAKAESVKTETADIVSDGPPALRNCVVGSGNVLEGVHLGDVAVVESKSTLGRRRRRPSPAASSASASSASSYSFQGSGNVLGGSLHIGSRSRPPSPKRRRTTPAVSVMPSLVGSIFSGGSIHASGATIFGSYYSGSGGGSVVMRGVMINSDGTFVIDGQEYKADEVTVRTEYKIKSTGHAVYTEPRQVVLQVKGDNATVSMTSTSGDLEIQCDKPCSVRTLKTTSGNVRVTGNADDINTVSGDVNVEGSVSGSVSTVSGDVRTARRR